MELNAAHRRYDGQSMPSPGDELMLYQMIVGAWPVELDAADAEGVHEFAERLVGWQLKAMREAKLQTDWNEPNLDYEDAARSFLYTIMSDNSAFVTEAANFAHRIGPAGAINGLAQTLLKLTVPGNAQTSTRAPNSGTRVWWIPTTAGRWIFEPRVRRLPTSSHWRLWRTVGAMAGVKQALIHRVLDARQSQPELFARGTYQPLQVTGALADHVVAFARSLGDAHCIVVAPRLTARLLAGGDIILMPPGVWDGTELHLPRALHGVRFRTMIGDDVPSPASPWSVHRCSRRLPWGHVDYGLGTIGSPVSARSLSPLPRQRRP